MSSAKRTITVRKAASEHTGCAALFHIINRRSQQITVGGRCAFTAATRLTTPVSIGKSSQLRRFRHHDAIATDYEAMVLHISISYSLCIVCIFLNLQKYSKEGGRDSLRFCMKVEGVRLAA